MEIFADTADLKEIRTWLDFGVIDGVTTNPSIMLAGGVYDLRVGAVDIARLLDTKPLSVEVVTDDLDDMHTQAVEMASWAPNMVIKIPIITTQGDPCLGVIARLASAGVKVNATACLSFTQAMLAAKAGATYISMFAGRISDEGADASLVIRNTAEWLKAWNMPSKIIVGSIRESVNVQSAALAGAHVVTVPPKFLRQMIDHKYTRFTVAQFLADGRSAAERITALGLTLETNGRKKTAAVRGKLGNTH
jgi:transaldolase